MRIGIVGCGLIGQKRAVSARAHEIIAVADRDRGRAEDAGGAHWRHGFE